MFSLVTSIASRSPISSIVNVALLPLMEERNAKSGSKLRKIHSMNRASGMPESGPEASRGWLEQAALRRPCLSECCDTEFSFQE